ncbi:MAG: hypothetical protein JWP08_356 [Bryobacterales bacterium]|nr:hypothetical protein [Bryobacterales bacterium]
MKRKISYWTAIGLFSMAMTGSAPFNYPQVAHP